MNAHAHQLENRRLTRVADRQCSRPACSTPAVATLLMRYAEQQAVLTDLTVEDNPELYDLCAAHGDRTRPPRGWSLDDERSDDVDLVDLHAPRSVDDTVALLAAALRPESATEGLALVPTADTPASGVTAIAVLQDDMLQDEILEDEVADTLFVPEPSVRTEPTAADSARPVTRDPAPIASEPVVATEATPPAPVRRGWRVPAADRGGRRE